MMMSDDDIPGEEFGQCRPPLSEIIRSILDRYPDGQIFKVRILVGPIQLSIIFFYCFMHGIVCISIRDMHGS